MSEQKVRVTILPWNLSFHVERGTLLRDFLMRKGILIDFPCGGRGLCGQCKVIIDPATESGKGGKRALTEGEIDRGIRLACQTVIESDCTVTVMESQSTGVVWELSEEESQGIHHVPGEDLVSRVKLQVSEPTIEDQRSDWKRLCDASVEVGFNAGSIEDGSVHLGVVRECSLKLREYKWSIDGVFDDSTLLGIAPTGDDPIYGVAIDLGTTTVDIALHHLETGGMVKRMAYLNRQAAYGADVISRAGQFGESREGLRKAVIDTIVEGANQLLKEVGASPYTVFRSVVVGNPIMLHILLDLDPYQLTLSPYIPIISDSVSLAPEELDFSFQKWGKVETLPVISAYVGADTLGMILALGLDSEDVVSLSVDIGTNGEIVLSNRGKLLATSTAAGPAFEGAQIACGMRAIKGAIVDVKIGESDVRLKTIGDAQAEGICGTGLVSAVSELLRAGVIDNTGRLLEAGEIEDDFLKGRIFRWEDNLAFSLTEDNKVFITQRDIRELQLAKGAIRTGMESLIREAGISIDDIDVIHLAGNFGAGMDVTAAERIGLIPDVGEDRVDVVGNAALRGASMVLVSKTERDRARALPEKIKFVELSGKPEFQMMFAESMLF